VWGENWSRCTVNWECEADKTVTLEPGAVRITRFSDSLEVTTMHVPEQTQAMCRCGSSRPGRGR
jgi:hypothetical protein